LIAWSLALGFAAAAALIALERTAGVLLLAPLGLMTAALVLDGSLWLVASQGGPLGGVAALTAATLAPLIFAVGASLGSVAHLARPLARFLATGPASGPCPTSANALPILARQRD
jgi:hypothetical protein